MYWFKYTARNALPGFKNQYFAGMVTQCTDKMAAWNWNDGEVGNSTRLISTLISQGTEALTDNEREVLSQHDDGGSMIQIRDIIRGRAHFSSQSSHSQQGSTEWNDISFTGFTEWENQHKWVKLIRDWLPKFDPTAFLTRCHRTEAPTGEAAQLWVRCIQAMVNLMRQFLKTDADNKYLPNETFHQLDLVFQCLPILILRYRIGDTLEIKRKKMVANARNFLKGNWRTMIAKALAECDAANKTQARWADKRRGQRPNPTDDLQVKHSIALEQTRKLNYGKAMGLLRSPGMEPDSELAIKLLCELHPPEDLNGLNTMQPPEGFTPNVETFDFINAEWLSKHFTTCRPATAVCQFGWDVREMWYEIMKNLELMEDLAEVIFRPIAAGFLAPRYMDHLRGGRLLAPSKFPKPGVRPLVIGDGRRRIVAKGLLKLADLQFRNYFQEKHPRALQFAGNVRNGATNMFHAITALAERDLHQDPNARYNLNAILAFDVKNAFNTVSRKHILSLLQKGCSKILGLSSVQPRITSNKPMGWDVLWPHVLAHYGGRGLLKYYHDGEVTEICSESGVHQGCPLGSTLFAFALHPILIEIAEAFPSIIIFAYADNVVMTGPLQDLRTAADMYKSSIHKIGLQLNPSESELYVPAWAHFDSVCPDGISYVDGNQCITTDNGLKIPWRKNGIKILGCAVGTDQFKEGTIKKTAEKILIDLDILAKFKHLHQRSKLAQYCVNTRTSYYPRSTNSTIVLSTVQKLDEAFDTFYANI